MTQLVKENHKCFQGEEILSLFVVCVDGKRVFASEDFEVLEKSPETLKNDGDTVIFQWDRNSIELPSFGPAMDEDYSGELRVRKESDFVISETQCNDDTIFIGKEWKQIWDKIVERFFRKELSN